MNRRIRYNSWTTRYTLRQKVELGGYIIYNNKSLYILSLARVTVNDNNLTIIIIINAGQRISSIQVIYQLAKITWTTVVFWKRGNVTNKQQV